MARLKTPHVCADPLAMDVPSETDLEVLNARELFERLDGDRELLADLVDLFFDDLPARVQQMRQSQLEGDLETLLHSAHSLQGSVSNFCAPAAFRIAQQLVGLARSGNEEGLKVKLDALEEALKELSDALHELLDEE